MRWIGIGLLAGVGVALYLLPWYAGVGVSAGLIVLAILAGVGRLRRGPAPPLDEMMAVLEGAGIEVVTADAVDAGAAWAGALPEHRQRVEATLEPGFDWFWVVDLIIQPTASIQGPLTWWLPSELRIRPVGSLATTGFQGPTRVLHTMIWQGSTFEPDDGGRYVGPLRLRLGVASTVKYADHELVYVRTAFGRLPLTQRARIAGNGPAALHANAGFHIPPPDSMMAMTPEPMAEDVGPGPTTAIETDVFGPFHDPPEPLRSAPLDSFHADSGVRSRMRPSRTSPSYRFPSEVVYDVYSTVKEKFRIPPLDGLDPEPFRPVGRHERPERFGRNVLPPNGIPDPAPEVVDELLHATWCYRIRVVISESDDLSYLARSLTTAASLARAVNGVIRDVQTKLVFTPREARKILKSPEFLISDHVLTHTLVDPDGGTGLWIHTHGMGKFGRPDIEMRAVPDQYEPLAVHALLTVADYMSQGAVVKPGETLQLGRAFLTFTLASPVLGAEEFPNGVIRITDFDPETSAPAVGVLRWLTEVVG